MIRTQFLTAMSLAALMTVATPIVFSGTHTLGGAAHASETAFQEALALHDAARDGNGTAQAAVAALEAYTAAAPSNALGWAYLGSSYALAARDARNVTQKIRFTNRGLRYLDQAVVLAPDDFVVRLIRANVLMGIPTMFGRNSMLVEDLKTLDQMYQHTQDPRMAGHMVGIYGALNAHAKGEGNWLELQASARSLAGSS